MTDCIFCKIIAGEIPGNFVHRDEQITAFHDIQPAAPVHILVIPNKHIPSMNEVSPEDQSLLGHLLASVAKIASAQGLAENGYRVIINTGAHANQVVKHLHIHILGGHKLHYPMG